MTDEFTTSMKIKTNVFESGLIEQETLFNDHGLVGQITRKLIDTGESQIREALIKLGWTPPLQSDRRYEAIWGDEDMGVRENKVERYLDEEVEKLSGLTRKWITTNHTGVPDRIVILQGEVWFVEVKTLDGRLSSDQKREHRRLKDAGAKVTTVYGKTGVDSFMEYFKC